MTSDRHYEDQFERWAASAWSRLELSPPCDLQAVCDFLRIRVERRIMPNDLHGMYMRLPDGTQAIKINSGLETSRQRFVWAHEIGHCLINRKKPGELVLEFRPGIHHGTERECDRFAACLLMPEAQIRAMAAELNHPSLNKTRNLAIHFGVSACAMQFRLRDLALQWPEARRR